MEKIKILITGCAGFIGGTLALKLIDDISLDITGIDNLNNYYDVHLKEYRLNLIKNKDKNNRFTFIRTDISQKDDIIAIFDKVKPDIVIHLAAQAGVRYSVENPDIYIQSNIVGFYNMLEACRYCKEKLSAPVKHFLFASSSSVYGDNKKIPYSEIDNTDKPVSLYAATKKTNEIIGYAYSGLYEIPMTGMRFFTVYGPAGRPDMAYYKFAEKLIANEKIELYNNGQNKRDFTYIDDVIMVIKSMIYNPPQNDEGVRFQIYNIGNNHPIDTISFLNILVNAMKYKGLIPKEKNINELIKYCDAVAGDVNVTYADDKKIKNDFNIAPSTELETGLKKFIEWFTNYRGS